MSSSSFFFFFLFFTLLSSLDVLCFKGKEEPNVLFLTRGVSVVLTSLHQ